MSGTNRKDMELNTQTLKNSSLVVYRSNELLAETEEIANDSLVLLVEQRKQIKDVRLKLDDVDSEIEIGRETIRRMNRSKVINSVVFGVVIFVLFAVLMALIYVLIRVPLSRW
jgi:hypothetical protein